MHSRRPLSLHAVKTGLSFFLLMLLAAAPLKAASLPHILVLSETEGWDHQTRSVADSVITALGNEHGFSVTATNSSDGYFTSAYLATCAAVCFINTTGTIFTDNESTAFQQYMKNGGGYVGVHASTDCEYEITWYAEMTGANFNGHPFDVAEAQIAVLDKNHPSTGFITGDTLIRTDEWYFWADNPAFQNKPLVDPAENSSITVLMELVESSINGSQMNHFHPICWYKSFGEGRVWYCGFGHAPETFNDSLMKQMLSGGIRYAAGQNTDRVFKQHSSTKESVPVDIALYDTKGRFVGTRTGIGTCTNTPSHNIRLLPYANGVYFAVIRNCNGIALRQRTIHY